MGCIPSNRRPPELTPEQKAAAAENIIEKKVGHKQLFRNVWAG